MEVIVGLGSYEAILTIYIVKDINEKYKDCKISLHNLV